MDRDHILRTFDYHHWASDRVLDALAAATAEQLDKPWGGSFGTGRALLRHVVGVERLWLDRWNGTSLKALPEFPATFSGRDFLGAWKDIKAEQQDYLSELSSEQLTGELFYANLKGERLTYPLADVLVHVVNHGTYHRGQLTHLLRDLGLAALPLDYLVFIEERRKGRP